MNHPIKSREFVGDGLVYLLFQSGPLDYEKVFFTSDIFKMAIKGSNCSEFDFKYYVDNSPFFLDAGQSVNSTDLPLQLHDKMISGEVEEAYCLSQQALDLLDEWGDEYKQRLDSYLRGVLSPTSALFTDGLLYYRQEHRFADTRSIEAGDTIALGMEANSEVIPASDRIVRLDDNNPDVIEIREDFDRLHSTVDGINDLSLFKDTTKEAVLVNLDSVRNLFTAKSVTVGTISAFALSILYGVASKVSDALSTEIAQKLISLIKSLPGM